MTWPIFLFDEKGRSFVLWKKHEGAASPQTIAAATVLSELRDIF